MNDKTRKRRLTASFVAGQLVASKGAPKAMEEKTKGGTIVGLKQQLQASADLLGIKLPGGTKVDKSQPESNKSIANDKVDKVRAALLGRNLAKPTAEDQSMLQQSRQVTRKRLIKPSSTGATKVKAKSTSASSKTKPRKIDIICALLKRNNGCTRADVLEATGWQAVSMPQQAKALGLKLVKTKDGDGRVLRYFGK